MSPELSGTTSSNINATAARKYQHHWYNVVMPTLCVGVMVLHRALLFEKGIGWPCNHKLTEFKNVLIMKSI
jgi:hypothetical protein